MTQTEKLNASDAEPDDQFGNSLSIHNDTIVVGSYKDDILDFDEGSAYVFVRPVNGWTDMFQTAKLVALNVISGNQFGYSVSIYNNTIIIGCINDNQVAGDSGSGYIFSKPTEGWNNATQDAILTASDGVLMIVSVLL